MVRLRPQIDRRLFVSAAALFGASAVLGTVPAWADDEDAGEGEDPDAEKENPDEPDAEEKLAQADAVYQRVTSLQNELAEAALESMQDRDRAEAAQASSAQVRRAYAYNIPSVPIPANGSVVDYALSRIGCPYVWGAEGPETFDCSGLVRWAYLQVGISLPHQTESLYYTAAAQLPVEDAQPGDVLWISYSDGYSGHVAIACNEGGTHYVHAPTFGAFVRDTDPLSWAGFTHALRFA